MEIKIINYDQSIDITLIMKIKKLSLIIKSDFELDVHFINGKYSLLRWANDHKLNEKALNVFVVSNDIYDFLHNVIEAKDIVIIHRESNRLQAIEKIVRFILSLDNTERLLVSKEKIILTKPEAQTLFDMFMSNKPLGKKRWNLKKRVKNKLGFKDYYEVYLWWRLSESLPAKTISSRIKIAD